MFLPSLIEPRGQEFIRLAHEHDKSVLVWTVNVLHNASPLMLILV